MERKPISELARLRIQNCTLTLRLVQLQVEKLLEERDKFLLEEMQRLECKPGEWQLDDRTWELISVNPPVIEHVAKEEKAE